MLTLFGTSAVTVMLLAYALEHRSAWRVLVFALACAASSVYGWLGFDLAIRRGGRSVGSGRFSSLVALPSRGARAHKTLLTARMRGVPRCMQLNRFRNSR
jgi:hypothetical protein